jgi:hypothetical protein
MADSDYSVKINRSEGIVEITGSDKDWIAEQIEKLAVVFSSPTGSDGPESSGKSVTGASAAGRQGPARKPRSRGGTKRRGGASSRSREKLELAAPVQKKLEEFKDEREAHFTSRQDQAAIIAYFLEEEAGLADGITQNDLADVYEIMGWRAPVNPRAVINNARDRHGYFRGWVGGRTKLSVGGRNFVLHDAVKKPESESE